MGLNPQYTKPTVGLKQQIEIREKIDKVFYKGRVIPAHTKFEHFYRDKEDGEVYPSVTTVLSVIAKPYLKQWAVNRGVEFVTDWAIKMPVINKVDLYEVLERSKTAHKNVLEKAAMWGNHGHDLVDKYVDLWISRGARPTQAILDLAEPDISLEGSSAALSASLFFDKHTLFPIVTEKLIISKKHKIGGTLDSLWLMGKVHKGREGDVDCAHQWLERKNGDIVCSECARHEKLTLVLIDLKTSNQIVSIDYALQVSAYSAILTEMCKVRPKIHWILQLNKNKPDYTVGVIDDVKKYSKVFLHAMALSEVVKNDKEPIRMFKTKKTVKL